MTMFVRQNHLKNFYSKTLTIMEFLTQFEVNDLWEVNISNIKTLHLL